MLLNECEAALSVNAMLNVGNFMRGEWGFGRIGEMGK
jgi:hypothetical protein